MKPPRPGLLVSVRSAEEARDAYLGGASVIDVKDPSRGPLGAADPAVWQQVRQIVPSQVPVSVALGELGDWKRLPPPPIDAFEGVAFRKLGLAHVGPYWSEDWAALRGEWGGITPWIAVIYADWEVARSPEPDAVIRAASRASCAGVLIDSWDKTRGPIAFDDSWAARFRRIRDTVGLVAIAGCLNVNSIKNLRTLDPDLFAVRGAACVGGNRMEAIDRDRVADLSRRVHDMHPSYPV